MSELMIVNTTAFGSTHDPSSNKPNWGVEKCKLFSCKTYSI